MREMIQREMVAHQELFEKVIVLLQDDIQKVCEIVVRAIRNDRKILLFGNRGSAADAQHIAAELSGRYRKERQGLPALALTTDTSVLTAVSNDYGYNRVFDRQVEALAREGDVLIGISTSGGSLNVINALARGKELGCICVGFSGRDGGAMNKVCDVNVVIPSEDTPRIQEMHILVGHIVCQAIENNI